MIRGEGRRDLTAPGSPDSFLEGIGQATLGDRGGRFLERSRLEGSGPVRGQTPLPDYCSDTSAPFGGTNTNASAASFAFGSNALNTISDFCPKLSLISSCASAWPLKPTRSERTAPSACFG